MEQLAKRLFNWASILEPGTREQAERTATMPFIWPHLALMPDAHLGKGATVGSVIPTLGAIMPAAVGVDIGCGMMAARRCSASRPSPMSSLTTSRPSGSASATVTRRCSACRAACGSGWPSRARSTAPPSG